MVEVIDYNNNGIKSEILEGGVGQTKVKLKIVRLVLREIDVMVRIYGYHKRPGD